MKIAIVGSRTFRRTNLVREFIDSLSERGGTIVVTGDADGVDTVAANYSIARGLKCWRFAIDRSGLAGLDEEEAKTEFRRRAYRRNDKIVEAAEELHAFWNGTSPGTRYTIEKACKKGIGVRVIGEDGQEIFTKIATLTKVVRAPHAKKRSDR